MMKMWIVAGIVIVIIIMLAVLAAMVILDYQEKKRQESMPQGIWHIEIWSIADGYRLVYDFKNHLILGRSNIYESVSNPSIRQDSTISRQHCMLYEQQDGLWIWNLSMVNPAVVNGHRVNAPRRIVPGDRLELGYSSFLVTCIEYY